MLAVDDMTDFDAERAGRHDSGGRSSVMIVCSPRPRVGKTLVARLLTDFFLADGRRVFPFDANPDDPVLSDYLPLHAMPASVVNTRGQIALFDRLIINDETPKVIDLASDQFVNFFYVMKQIGFVEAARARGIDTVILFVAEDHPKSAQSYRHIRSEFHGATLVPVHNDVTESYGAPGLPHPAAGAMPVHIPHLPPHLLGVIKRPGFSFADYQKRPAEFPTQLHKWISQPFIAFRDLELRLSLAGFAPLFRYRA